MIGKNSLLVAALLLASAALAHQGVKNEAVMARMNAMTAIGANMKTLGDMARGKAPFDAGQAGMAAQAIARHAAEVPALFEAQEHDPKSEARPAIWENFGDFSAKARDLEEAAEGAAQLATLDDLQGAMKRLGASCASCHEAYRK